MKVNFSDIWGNERTFEVEPCEGGEGEKFIKIEGNFGDLDVIYLTPQGARQLAITLLEMSDEA